MRHTSAVTRKDTPTQWKKYLEWVTEVVCTKGEVVEIWVTAVVATPEDAICNRRGEYAPLFV